MPKTDLDEDPHPLKKKIAQNIERQNLIDEEFKIVMGRDVRTIPRRKFNELKVKKSKKNKELLSTSQINCSQQAEINLHSTRTFLPQHHSYNFSTTQNYHYNNQLCQIDQQVNLNSMVHHYFGFNQPGFNHSGSNKPGSNHLGSNHPKSNYQESNQPKFSQSDHSSVLNESNVALKNFGDNESSLPIHNVSINQQQNDFNIPYNPHQPTLFDDLQQQSTNHNPYQTTLFDGQQQQSTIYNLHQSNFNTKNPQQPNNSTHLSSSIQNLSSNNNDANLTDTLLNEIMEVIRSDETRSRSDPSNVFVKTCYVYIEESKTSQTLEQSSSNITGWRRIKYIFLVEKRWKKRKREQSYFLNKKN